MPWVGSELLGAWQVHRSATVTTTGGRSKNVCMAGKAAERCDVNRDICQGNKGCETDKKARHGAGEVTQRWTKVALGDRLNILNLI